MTPRAVARCPKCATVLPAAREHADGLPGILYDICNACGWARAITRKARKERIAEAPNDA